MSASAENPLSGVPSSVACAADPRVRALSGMAPIVPGTKICGPARTAQCAAGQNGAIHHAVHAACAGDVIIVAANSDTSYGYVGELLSLAATKRGVAGLVIDGTVRDIGAIRALGFPVFALGANPGQTGKSVPGSIDIPIVIDGTVIHSGDFIVADEDGVAVVPSSIAPDVAIAAELVLAREDEIRIRLNQGESTVEIFNLPTE